MPETTIYTTEKDVALDIVAALDMFAGLFGSDETVIETIGTGRRDDKVCIVLDNGDEYEVTVTRIN